MIRQAGPRSCFPPTETFGGAGVAERVISIIKLLPVGVAGGYGFSPEHAFGPPPHPPPQPCGRSALAGQQAPPQADWQALICGPAEGPADVILALAASKAVPISTAAITRINRFLEILSSIKFLHTNFDFLIRPKSYFRICIIP